jgi:hypothetical protein
MAQTGDPGIDQPMTDSPSLIPQRKARAAHVRGRDATGRGSFNIHPLNQHTSPSRH